MTELERRVGILEALCQAQGAEIERLQETQGAHTENINLLRGDAQRLAAGARSGPPIEAGGVDFEAPVAKGSRPTPEQAKERAGDTPPAPRVKVAA